MEELLIFTDGSCMNNGKLNAIGGIGIHFPNKELKDVSKVFRHDKCTNQRTELYAVLTALRYINHGLGLENYKIIIKTDSDYVINCITKWAGAWSKNDWIKKDGQPVANREYIESIYKYYKKYNIEFYHVNAHTGGTDSDSIGNDKADKLAVKASYRNKDEIKNNTKTNTNAKTNTKTKTKSKSGSKINIKSNDRTKNKNVPKTIIKKNNILASKKNINNNRLPTDTNFIVELIGSEK